MRRPLSAAAAALLLVLQSASLALAQVASGAAAAQPATILRLSGDVHVRPAGEAAFRRAHERERLLPGSEIRTGAGAEVILQLSERNLVRIGEETDFSIDEASVSTEVLARQGGLLSGRRRNVHHFRMGVGNGEALSVLRGLRGNSSFEMHTPVATAGVRGTIFSTEVTRKHTAGATKRPATKQAGGSSNGNAGGDVTTNFTCYEGSLEVSGQGIDGTVDVPAGYSMTVTGNPGGGEGAGLGGGEGEGAGAGGEGAGEPGEAEGAAAEGGEAEGAAAEGGPTGEPAAEGAAGDEGGAAPTPVPGLEPIGGATGGATGGAGGEGGALPPTVTSVTVVLAPITTTDAALTGTTPPPPDVSAMVALPGGSLVLGIGGGSGICPE